MIIFYLFTYFLFIFIYLLFLSHPVKRVDAQNELLWFHCFEQQSDFLLVWSVIIYIIFTIFIDTVM